MVTTAKRSRLKTFASAACRFEDVYTTSVQHLKHLVVTFRLSSPSSKFTLLWHTALTYLGNAMLTTSKDETWYYYFLLCIYGYERLGRSWRVTKSISTALLSMAMRQGDLSSENAIAILHDLDEITFPDLQGEVRATFMADLDLAQTDPEGARVESQAGEFGQNAMFDELTYFFDGNQ